MGRRRRAFSTGPTFQVLKAAKRQRGYTHDRSVRVHELLCEWLDARPPIARAMRAGDSLWSTALEEQAAADVAATFKATEQPVGSFLGGLAVWLGWSAAEFFIKWLVRRLIRAWLDDPHDFAQCMEREDDGFSETSGATAAPGPVRD